MLHWRYNLENKYNKPEELFVHRKQRTKPKGSKHSHAEKPLMGLTAGCHYYCLTLISMEVPSAKFWNSGRMTCSVLKLKIKYIYIYCSFCFSHILTVQFSRFLRISQNISLLYHSLLGRLVCIKAAKRMEVQTPCFM